LTFNIWIWQRYRLTFSIWITQRYRLTFNIWITLRYRLTFNIWITLRYRLKFNMRITQWYRFTFNVNCTSISLDIYHLNYTVRFCYRTSLYALSLISFIGYGVSNFCWLFYWHFLAITFYSHAGWQLPTVSVCSLYVVYSDVTESGLCIQWLGKVVCGIVWGLLRKICSLSPDNVCCYLVNRHAFLALLSVNRGMCRGMLSGRRSGRNVHHTVTKRRAPIVSISDSYWRGLRLESRLEAKLNLHIFRSFRHSALKMKPVCSSETFVSAYKYYVYLSTKLRLLTVSVIKFIYFSKITYTFNEICSIWFEPKQRLCPF
jgi:hypothetical protein